MKKFRLQTWLFGEIIILLHVCAVNTFNLEARNPIIKRGKDGSYFGYSVAEHMENTVSRIPTNWILVGAPLGNNLQPGTNKSGALWKCPISYFEDDCTQVMTDGRRSEEINVPLSPPGNDEIKDDQWMGVTVRSQGPAGLVLVCAHRYTIVKEKNKTNENRYGLGLCYTLTNDLDYDFAHEPCKGRPLLLEHLQFGYCQVGTSATLLSDGTAIFGAPGPYIWKGTLFVSQVGGDFLSRDKTTYMGPVSDQLNEPVEKDSYLGMSVTGGNFFGKETVYAAGAPRSGNTGQVLIFAKRGKNIATLEVKLKLQGEQLASSFGYEITTANVNGDNRTDLIVSAPFYFSRESGGAVYVYTDLISCKENCKPQIKLTGKIESRFGFAVSTLGDTNKDGYDDIAIGAPYEGDGAVYIYLGSKNGLLSEPSQIIRPSPYSNIKTLGYSLSGGLDIVPNGYPELLVGAYESDAVILYAGRPIIDIESEIIGTGLKNIDPSKQRCIEPRSNTTCFTFKACCTLKPQIQSIKINDQNLLYKIEAETFSGERKFSRVYFKNDDQRSNVINRVIHLTPRKYKYCQEETVYLKDNTRDILSPIKFRLNYTLGEDNPHSVILNKQESQKIFMATFQKDCGSNDICESFLVLHSKLLLQSAVAENDYILTLGEEDEVKLDIKVSNDGEPAYETQLFIIHPSSLSYIATGKKSNIVCNYKNETLVVCNLGNPFKKDQRAEVLLRFEPKHLAKSETKLKFHIHVNSTSKELSTFTTSVLTAFVVKRAEVGITGSAISNVLYGGEVKGESAMKYFDDIGSRVIHKYQVANNGPWKIEYLEVHIEWPYQVANNKPQGKWLLYLEEKPIIDGGEMCMLTSDMVNPLGLQIRPGTQDMINDNEIFDTENDLSYNKTVRRKRDTEMVIRPEQHIDRDGHKRQVVNMNCQNGTAKCLKFYCIVKNLEKNNEVTIKIRSRLWNSTLVEDYPRIDWVRIVSSARIYIPDEYAVEQLDEGNDNAMVETLAYPDLLEQEAEPVPLWIIILAVLAGVILLIILTIILRKVGFFKRQRLDPTLSGNLEKHSREQMPFLGGN